MAQGRSQSLETEPPGGVEDGTSIALFSTVDNKVTVPGGAAVRSSSLPSLGEKQSLVSLASEHASAGRSSEALRIYQALLETDPNDCSVLMGLGELCLMLNDSATASKFLHRVLKLDPTHQRASEALAAIRTNGENQKEKLLKIPQAIASSTTQPRVIRPIPLWDRDASFRKILRQIPYTLVDPVRCYMLYQFALQASRIEGDTVEVGVYRGGTARLLAMVLQPSGRRVHLFDTFEGMPSTDPAKDEHRQGDFSDTSLEAVKKNLEGLENVLFHPGFFPDTAPPIATMNFSLVHVDVDIYSSVLNCCEFFYGRMVQGGMMVFDDYGFETCPGAKQGVDEFFRETRERPCYLPSGQCVVVKI